MTLGEPRYPVAAAERGKRVLVSRELKFEVSDHDFCKFSLIPSVCLIVDIPDDITGSWYSGQVLIGLKEGAFEPSSPLRHMTELYGALLKYDLLSQRSILFLYTDGGPDHRLTYLSVKLSLITLFLKCDFDFLCACRTAPFHSWRNPAERVMSILNLGLQCVGLMRKEMNEVDEAAIATCNSISKLRSLSLRNNEIVQTVLDSIEPVKDILCSIFRRLELHDRNFLMYPSASEEEMVEMWSILKSVDPSLDYGNVYRQASLKKLVKLDTFLQHCCQSRHYSFSIKKCGIANCSICKPVRMQLDIFKNIHHLPDPIPSEDGHFEV